MDDLYRYVMLVLHGSVSVLHTIELSHVPNINVMVLIGACFTGISLAEFFHLMGHKKKK